MNCLRNSTRALVGAVMSLVATTAAAGPNTPAQTPLFVSQAAPALNMLVMGRDHKLYYEAYNDASDLDGDGLLDVGFKPGITYYGYFNNSVCYEYANGRFEPSSAAGTGNTCSDAWSGNFLNYLATSRMDALRKVLYGGFRRVDSTSETVLEAAFIPQDAHSWGKEYDPVRDTYAIGDYAPLAEPSTGYRHLFAVTTLSNDGTPQLRVLNNTSFRIWNWVSKEGLVASDKCVNNSTLCTSGGVTTGWQVVPADRLSNLKITTWRDSTGSPVDRNGMDALFNAHSSTTLCGSGSIAKIDTTGSNNNPFSGINNCTHDGYHTLIKGKITVDDAATYRFAVNGDDAVDVKINGVMVAGWYGGHGADSSDSGLQSHSGTITLAAGTYDIEFRHEEGSGGDNWGLYWKLTSSGDASTLTDYALQVVACPADANLREANCKAYPNGGTTVYKPTGILHDFGEDERMHFGLLTGSYAKNTAGGVLRSNMSSFTEEVDADTGQFETDVDGIVSTINKLRITDFNYSGTGQYNNCGWIVDGPITSATHLGKCAMWGNPIAEMMYETLRYYAGASEGRSEFTYAAGAKDSLAPLELAAPAWTPPYSEDGGYLQCSRPVMTVLSDINPSYDFKLPGSKWQNIGNSGDPSALSGFNVASETDDIGVAEALTGKSVFIGESNSVKDGAPTAKTITDLSTVRGLSPEEPTKEGTYYSAGVAKFGAENAIGGSNEVMSYMVALASPLPQIRFPVGSNTVTVVPFAKSVGEYSIGAFKPTNQIVDYYVIEMANTDPDGSDQNLTVNGGRPYMQFRINFEDVEQGADHDMDAIVLYTLAVNANNTLTITLNSEYAKGTIVQHVGYVISGTTADGVYLEVRDVDTAAAGSYSYALNTPPGKAPGWCATASNAGCSSLPLNSSRDFVASGLSAASLLNDPLWYAAKYGMPDRDPATVTGDPDNYFLVTNALTLKDQLTQAFNDIMQRNSSITSPAVVPQLNSNASGNDYAVYRTSYDVSTWSGDLVKEQFAPNAAQPGTLARTVLWRASEELPPAAQRVIKMINADGDGLVDLTWTNIVALGTDGVYGGVNLQQALAADPDTPAVLPAVDADGQLVDADDVALGEQRLAFVMGTDTTFRARDSLLGDIVNSSPVVVEGAQYLAYLAERIDGASGDYSTFAAAVKDRSARIYVGANDGMLHAFDAETGEEKFAFVPSAVIRNLNVLTSADYNEEGGRHHYFVDGTPVVRDVYINDEWRTVLVGSLRGGGKSLFALDITDPDAITLLWEFNEGDDLAAGETLSDLGYSFPTPTLARLHSGEWAVVTGNGYDSATGRATLLLIDIETGALIRKIPTAAADADNGLSTVRVADNNSDGVADYVYAGDLKGNLWRFDLVDTSLTKPLERVAAGISSSKFKVSFGGSPLYAAKDGTGVGAKVQPITAPPSLVRHPSYTGYIVLFGTGRYFTDGDLNTTGDVQTLYGIWDRQTAGETATSTPTLTRANLQAQTFTDATHTFVNGATTYEETIRLLSQNSVTWYQAATGSGQHGWYVDFAVGSTRDGERLIDEMLPRGQVLFLTTRVPNEDPCSAGLGGWNYFLDPTTGGRTRFNVVDFNRDGLINGLDSYSSNAVISGRAASAGGLTLTDNKLFGSEVGVAPLSVSPGRLSTGRQSWQMVPNDDSATTPVTPSPSVPQL